MTNWARPTLGDLYTDFLDFLNARDVDAATLFLADPSNHPVGAFRYNRSLNLFQEWNGTAWVTRVLAQAGGGTGAGNLPALGTMASQNANNVAITGGTISGLNSLSVNGAIVAGGNINSSVDIGCRDSYATGGFVAGPGNRRITNPPDGTILSNAIGYGYTGGGTKVLIDNNTWVPADQVGGGGMIDIVHNDAAFGTGELSKTFNIPWNVAPASIRNIELQLDEAGVDSNYQSLSGLPVVFPIRVSWVLLNTTQFQINRSTNIGTYGGTIGPANYYYTAKNHKLTP